MEPQKRHWARRLALQALYQWQISGHGIDELLSQFVEDENWDKADKDYFVELVSKSIDQSDEIVQVFTPYLNIPVEQIDPIEKAVLLFASYELMNRTEIPKKVILSEATNLCKKFGSSDGFKFVNAVLDKIALDRL